MKPASLLHDFLMSVPSPAVYTILGLMGSSMVMSATGIDFTITVDRKNSAPIVTDEDLPTTDDIGSMMSNIEVRRAVIESAVRSLAKWDGAVRLEDDADARAARESAYESLSVIPWDSVVIVDDEPTSFSTLR